GRQRDGVVYVEFNNQQGLYLNGYKGLRLKATDHSVDFEIYDTIEDEPEAQNLAGTSDEFIRLQQRMKDEVLRIRMPNKHAKKAYDGEFVPGLDVDEKTLQEGVLAQSYLGKWDWVPDFTGMVAKKSSRTQTINLDPLPVEQDGGLLFSGFLRIPKAGDWTFQGEATGGFILKIHNKLVIDGDYQYQGAPVSGTVRLAEGIHPYRLFYRTSAGKPALSLRWEGPNVEMGALPVGALLVKGP
ncbi:MAG TPA: hypothetical protein DD438_06670, partial [Verrucomicrobiales bacterium]|nr:hypothetical protein [Verrucomicrobiales bacterium]